MAQKSNKSNKKFMVLSAIGIFMVVDQHTFTAFNILGDFIPYNSFFMPMFVFISGYFNKVDGTTKLGAYTLRKIKSLLLPYTGIAVAVFGIQWLLNLIKTGEVPSYPGGYIGYMLENVITIGTPYAMVTPMWFAITLFATLMIYAVIKKLLTKLKIWNSYVMLAIFTCAHLYAVYQAQNMEQLVSPGETNYFLLPLKVLFFLPFLELGVIYREHLEGKHAAMPGGAKIGLMSGLLIFNMVRTVYLPAPYDVAFDSINDMTGFTSPYIVTPLVSSLVGILFWLTFVELIGKPVFESRFVNYMSCNTFWIMGLHIAFFNIFNLILMLISEHITELPFFDADYFRGSEWYYWEISPGVKIVYVLIGILGPLGCKWVFDRIKQCVLRDKKQT